MASIDQNRTVLAAPFKRLRSACLVRLAALCALAGAVMGQRADAATMQLATTNVGIAASFSVPLYLDSGTEALGGYGITVSFDTNVLQFVSVTGGDGEFSSVPGIINTSTPGQVRYIHQQTVSTVSPVGVVLVSRINFTAVGVANSSSALTISNPNADNTDGLAIPITDTTDGLVTLLAPPQLQVSPSSRSFGALTMGQSFTLPFQVINSGGQALNGTATVGGPFSIDSGSPFNVAPGQTGTVNVTFSPVSAGSFSNAVVFTSNGGGSINTVTGTGLTPGQMVVSPFSLNLGITATGTTVQASFVVTNNGGSALSGSVSVGAGPFAIVSGTPFNLAGFGATNVVISFTPLSAGGFTNAVVFSSTTGSSTNTVLGTGAIFPVASFSGAPTNGLAPLPVTFTDASSGTITNRFWNFGDGSTTNVISASVAHTYPQSGTNSVTLIVSGPLGASTNTRLNYIRVTNSIPAQIVITPASRSFGSVVIGQTNTLPFSVINTGGLTLTGTATVGGPFAIGSGSPFNVAGGQTGTVNVSFIPLSEGAVSNTVVFSSNGGTSNNSVTGTGLTPGALGINPGSLNFGTIATNSTVQLVFAITNTGGSAVSGTASVGGAPFAIASGSPFNLPGFGATIITVSFTPTSVGTFSNNVIFASTGGGSTNLVVGSGAVVPTAAFTASLTNGLAPLNVTFADNSTGTITNRFWNFGDGSTTNVVTTNMVHNYTSAGTNTVTLIISGPLGASTNTRLNYIRVTNSIPAQIVITPASRSFGSVVVGQTNTLPFSVINTGSLTLTGTATVGGPFAISSGSPFNVAGGQTGTVNVSFIPLSEGAVSNTVVFSSNGGTSNNSVTGTGLTPGALGINPGSLNFGTIATNSTSQLVFAITNTGGSAVSGTASVGGAPFAIASGSPFNLPGFGATNIAVSFTPTSVGTFSNNVIFASTGGGSTNLVVGSGAVVPTAAFTASPTNGLAPLSVTFVDSSTGTITNRFWNFGDGSTTNVVTTNLVHNYTSAGTNTVTLIVSGPLGASTNIRTGLIVATNSPSPVATFTGTPTNGLAPLLVTFTDTSAGNITNRFWIFGDGSTTNVVSTNVAHMYALAGTNSVSLIVSGPGGITTNTRINYIRVTNSVPAQIVVTPASRNFGSVVVGQTNTQPFSVINSGGLTLTGTATVGGPFAISSGIPFNVAGGQTGTVNVSFIPLSAGAVSNTVVFSSNGGTSSNTVTGTGLTPGALGINPGSLNFGTIATNSTAQLVFAITNTGGSAVTGTANVGGAPFAIVSGTPFNLPGFGGTNVVVSFTPTSAGTFSNNVIFTSTAGNSTNLVVGTGAVAPIAGFTASPTNGLAPLNVTFVDNSTGTITNRFWNFGDGSTTNVVTTNLAHNYTSAGTNTVTLIVSGPLGASTNTRTGFIIVTNTPLDTTPPTLAILAPTENQSFTNAGISVSGTVSDASGIQSVTVNGVAATVIGSDWSRALNLSTGTNTITVIAKDNSANQNATTQTVHAILTPQGSGVDTTPPFVQIDSPSNGLVTVERSIDVSGIATDDVTVSSVVVTNNRGGSFNAVLNGTNWTATGALLKLGTNQLFAIATDGFTNRASDSVTVVRITTNYVNTTLRAGKVTLVLSTVANSDRIQFSGFFNNTGVSFNSTNDVVEVMFGDYEDMIPANSLVKLKFKGTNSLSAFSIVPKSKGINFQASGFTLTNGQPFLMAVALGTNDLGPDAIAFPGLTNQAGQFAWAFGKQLPAVDQFFLAKSKFTTNSFQLTGTINILAKPNVLTNSVSFGIGSYDETLPTNGWSKGAGNMYTYIRPAGHTGAVTAISLNLDLGRWTAKGAGANLSFLTNSPITDIRLEIADFAASYPAQLVPKGKGFSY